jgi:hypothetical protein
MEVSRHQPVQLGIVQRRRRLLKGKPNLKIVMHRLKSRQAIVKTLSPPMV